MTVEDGGVLCELATSKRVACHRYTFANGGTLKVTLAGPIACGTED